MLPRAQRPDRHVLARRVGVVAGVGFMYLLLIVIVVAPALGTAPGTRFWSQHGSTWWEVGRTVLGSPLEVLEAIATSGLRRLNASFGLIQWLAPWAAIAVTLPGGFFAIADSFDQRMLWYYNAAFLLPGMYLCAQAGFLRVLEWTRTWSWRWPDPIGRVFPVACVCVLLALTVKTLPATAGSPALVPKPAIDGPVRAALEQYVESCPGRNSVATDFHSVVFVPNTYERYFLRNFERAQVVLIPRSVDTIYLGEVSRDSLVERIRTHPRFSEAGNDQEVLVFVRDDAILCD